MEMSPKIGYIDGADVAVIVIVVKVESHLGMDGVLRIQKVSYSCVEAQNLDPRWVSWVLACVVGCLPFLC
jgi:hypothetical protein